MGHYTEALKQGQTRPRTRLPIEQRSYYTTDQQQLRPTSQRRTTADTYDDEELSDDAYTTRTTTSTRRYLPAPLPEQRKPKAKRKQRPFLYMCLGMLIILVLLVGANLLSNWWQRHQDDATYGYPRTYQFDAIVGHNGDSAQHPSHFILLNLKGYVSIVEYPAGDATKAILYTGPTLLGASDDLYPVTGYCKDVNGDGKPDLIITVQGQNIIYINTGTAFRALKPGEQINLNE